MLPANVPGRLGAEPRAAMPADVVERVDGAGGPRVMMMLSPSSSRTKNWPGVVDLLGAPGADPHAREQPFHLAVEVLPVDVVRVPAASARPPA